ncbi:acyl-CoA dehydrogenase family protein [Natronomonas marina]|uniref:acyl-CoA dehydrogenase family protein n=1 Tax=Natronomonas marina TaxID=2961939 RepID=UPI0020C963EA|nr:acyl-CoA dehydrogenase family protein [Natronomonas marina]
MADPIDYTAVDRRNYWELNRALQRTVRRRCGADADRDALLAEFGGLMGTTVTDNADIVEENPPELDTYDRRGEVANEVTHHPAHLENERLVYENGVIANLFSAPPSLDGPLAHVEHFAQFCLMDHTSSVGLSCPAAMTGGAALVLEKFDDGTLSEYYDALTARDYDELATGAMFLTEKQGGSDVGANEVRAEPTDTEGVYELHGEKWFCSNVDSEAALVLARRPDAPDGTEGLSLFLYPGVGAGDRDAVLFRRLKDKLGTKSVPTGEVEFRGAEAYLVGEPESGFKYMSEMLNMERLYNAVGSVGAIGRALLESKLHAFDREAFGEVLADQALMRRDLVDMAVTHEATMAVTFEAAAQFGARERAAGDADAEAAFRLMRILIPVVKYRTAREAVEAASYAMEIRGGDGYVEEQVHPRLLRNAQVLPIWEGPSNVMALDVLRSMLSELSHEALLSTFEARLDDVSDPRLADTRATVESELTGLADAFEAVATTDRDGAQLAAKELADYVFDVVAAVLLLERAQWRLEEADDAREARVAEWFVRRELAAPDARGIGDGERLPLSAFDAIVRYGRAEPEERIEAAADD